MVVSPRLNLRHRQQGLCQRRRLPGLIWYRRSTTLGAVEARVKLVSQGHDQRTTEANALIRIAGELSRTWRHICLRIRKSVLKNAPLLPVNIIQRDLLGSMTRTAMPSPTIEVPWSVHFVPGSARSMKRSLAEQTSSSATLPQPTTWTKRRRTTGAAV